MHVQSEDFTLRHDFEIATIGVRIAQAQLKNWAGQECCEMCGGVTKGGLRHLSAGEDMPFADSASCVSGFPLHRPKETQMMRDDKSNV